MYPSNVWTALKKSVFGEDDKININQFQKIINKVDKLPEEQMEEIDDAIVSFSINAYPQLEEKFNIDTQKTVDAPADVRVLPKGVKITRIKEELVSDLDKYTQIQEKLKIINTEKIGATGETLTNLLIQQKTLTKQAEDLKKNANIALSKKAKDTAQSARASKREGSLRPHLRNPTESAVQELIGETPEQQIQDFKNWYVFDIPQDQTGVGTSKTNPLVEQNNLIHELLNDGDIIKDFNTTYLIKPGVEEVKGFFHQHANIEQSSVNKEEKHVKVMSDEDKFLQSFNKNGNGFFTQDASVNEMNKWSNIYQPPADFYEKGLYEFQDVDNKSLMVSDFKSNLNYFVNP